MTKKLTIKVSRKDKTEILRGFRTFPHIRCGNSVVSAFKVAVHLKQLTKT